MNVKLLRLIVLIICFAAESRNVSAQVYNQNIQGYWNSVFMTGSNLFNNPLQSNTSNTLNVLFPNSVGIRNNLIPIGTTISLWNPTNSSFDTTSTFTNGSWSVNLLLPPGTGALVFTPSPFTNTISGYVLNHNGSPLTSDTPTLPPIFPGSDATYLFGDKCFINNVGTNIFLNIVGRLPYPGEKVTTLSSTSTYLGNGAWDSIPTLNVGSSAFLTIISESPPVLTIVSANNQTIVSWSPALTDWMLQTNSNLATGSWGDYAGTIINNTVTNSPSAGSLFFRLHYP